MYENTTESEDIEITPAMIEAGADVLRAEPAVFAGPFGVDCNLAELVAKVYSAMERVRQS